MYFLGCFYYKTGSIFEAVRTLKECIELKSEPPIGPAACELLDNIWDNAIRPPIWRWWWFSPLHCRLRRVISSIIAFFIVAPLIASPFIARYLPATKIDLPTYMFVVVLLTIVLALPAIQRIRAQGIEIELRPPPPVEPVFSPIMMETKLTKL